MKKSPIKLKERETVVTAYAQAAAVAFGHDINKYVKDAAPEASAKDHAHPCCEGSPGSDS
jgi:hypothetical protein